MKYKLKAKTTALLTLLVGSSISTQALADGGWEIGGAVGNVEISENLEEFKFEDNATSWRVFGGYNFGRFFGIEAGYLDLGSFRDTVDVADQMVDVSAEADGFTAAIKGMLPLGERFTAEARLGYYFYTAKATVAGIPEDDESERDPYAGVGLSYHLNDTIDLDLGFDYLDLDDIEPWMASLGVTIRF